jgi:hypothetical protein
MTRTLLLLALTVVVACGDDDAGGPGGGSGDAGGTDSAGAALEGCANWANWECTVSSGGCGASCDGDDILCNSGGTCNTTWDGESCDQEGAGSGCEICEAVVADCGAGL